MAEQTAIEWADATWNPVRGCTKVSPGCAHCYAETLSKRNPAVLGEWGPNGARVVAGEKAWQDPVRWARRHLRAVEAGEAEARTLRIFTASLGDWAEDHPVVAGVRARIWGETIPALNELRLPDGQPAAALLLLTKRAHIARPWFDAHGCPDVVWPGVTVEDQQRADERIPVMLGLPRLWLSMEPLLGPVDLSSTGVFGCTCPDEDRCWGTCPFYRAVGGRRRAVLNLVSWIIVGGESGPGARPMHPAWARSLRDQCSAAGVPFLLKQWGAWAPAALAAQVGRGDERERWFWEGDDRRLMVKVGKHAAGRLLDGSEHNEVPRG